MPDNKKQYTVYVDGMTTPQVYDEESFNRGKDNFFKDNPNAMVVESSAYDKDSEVNDNDFYTVYVDGMSKPMMLDAATFAKGKDKFLQDNPNAQITRGKQVNYWGDKLGEISTRIDALENELKGIPDAERNMGMSDADALDIIADTPERRRRNQINTELDQLKRERENNPAWQSYWEKQKEELKGSIKQVEEDADISKGVSVKNEKGEYDLRKYGSSVESDYFKTAKQFYKDALKTAEAPSKYDDSLGIVNFAKGAAENIGSAVSLLEFAKALKNVNVIGTVKQIQEAEGENVNLIDLIENQPERLSYLSPGQKEMMKAFIKRAEIEQDRSGDMSIGYNAGKGAVQSLGFMADFLLTGGAGSAAGKAVAKKIAKETAEDISAKTLSGAAKKLLVGNLEGATKALVMTPMMPSSYSNFLNSLTQLNEKGGMDLSSKAVRDAIDDAFVETFSENAGELFGIPFEGKLFDSLSKSKLGEVGKAMSRTGAGRFLNNAGWHGMVGEMAEEVLGNAIRSARGIDDDALKNFFSKDEFLTTLASFAPMSIIGGASSAYQVRKAGKRMSDSGEALAKVLGSYGLEASDIESLLNVDGKETPEELGKAIASIGRAADATGNVTDLASLDKALGDYAIAASKYKVLKGVFENEQDVKRASNAALVDSEVGDNSWYHQGEDGNYVRTITDAEGNERYVVTSGDGQLALVGRDGSKSFLTDAELEAGIADGTLTDSGEQPVNQYLDGMTEKEEKTAEAERMAEETNSQIAAIQERIKENPSFNIGTEEAPMMASVIDSSPNGVRVVWTDENGQNMAQDMTWEQVGNYLGTPVEVKTDEQIEQDEIDAEEDIRGRKEDYNNSIPVGTEFNAVLVEGEEPVTYEFQRAFIGEDGNLMLQVKDKETGKDEQITEEMALQGNLTTVLDSFKNQTPAQAEAEAIAEEGTPAEDDGVLRDFRGNPIPLKDDGTVNQTAFWNADPEAWAKWNDEKRGDGGENSRGYIAKAVKKLQGDAKAVQKQIAKELDFDKIEQLEGQLAQINDRISTLDGIEKGYAAAEIEQQAIQEETPAPVAPVAEATEAPVAEATPAIQEEIVPPTAEQVLDEFFADVNKRLGEAKTPEEREAIMQEKRQALEDYYAITTNDSTVVGTRADILQRMKEMGYSEKTIGRVEDQLNAKGVLTEGFHIGNTIFIVADDIRNAQRAKLTHLHEHWHEVNRQKGYPKDVAAMPGATTEYLLETANKLAGVKDKNGYGDYLEYPNPQQTLADEVIALSMEVIWESTPENVDENLRKAGLDNQEIINFVKTIYNGERGNDQEADSTGRDTLPGDNAQEGERQDGGDIAPQPEGILGEQGSGSGEGSDQGIGGGAEQGGEVTPTLSPNQQAAIEFANGEITAPEIRLDNRGAAANGEEVRFSVRYSWQDNEVDKIAQDIADQIGVKKSEAKKWVKSETSLAALITGESAFLDYEGDDRYTAIKQDSDYPQGTVDFNNICRKRLAFTEMYQRIQKAFPNTIITGEDLATIRNIMKKHDLMVACGLCYVEDRRQLLGEIAKDFIDNVNTNFDIYASRGGETKKKNAEKFRNLIGEDKKEDLSIYDLITLEGSTKLLREHPGIYNAFQAFNNARGQQSGNLFQGYAEYKREILKWNKKKVKSVNDNGGLRIFSYSDFEAHHLIDLVQIIQDCARKGVKIQGYTKVPAFARAVAETGAKLNRSLIPLGDTGMEDGKLAYDPVEGIDVNDENFLPSNDNIGNILIGINDEQIRLAMADPFVHFIIPYHSNQKDILRSMKQTGNWTNYKLSQTEKDANGKTAEHVNIYTDVLNAAEAEGKPIKNEREFTEKFLEVCKERGLTPRFAQFLDKNEAGEYVYTPGYYKFLVDFKLFDEQGNILPQMPVKAVFDDEFNAQILNDYVKGEKAKLGENLDEVYNEIVKTLGLETRKADIEQVNAKQKQPASDAVQPVVTEEDVMFRLSKNNMATVNAWLKKREDISDEQRAEIVKYIDGLDDAKTQLATAKWYANGTIRIPEDMKKVEQAISVAGKAKVDPLRYNSPMELLDAHAEFKPSEERINPDEVSTLHRSAEYPDNGIVVYDVDNTKESRENMRKIINTHFGVDASPWCLLQGDGKGNLTEQSTKYWKHYNAYPKQVAFKDGKLLAFSANDSHTRVWWDRQDQSHYGIPLTMKVEGDELGRSADHILNENKELGLAKANQEKLERELANKYNCPPYRLWELASEEDKARLETAKEKVNEAYINGGEPGWIVEPGGHMYRGNRQNGVYEEWNSDGDQLLSRTEYKDGKENGVSEEWYPSGQLWKRAVMKDDGYAGPYEMWYENGQQKMRVEMNERGEKDGEQVGWYKNGNRQYEARYSDGHYVGDRIDYYESGEPKSIIHYDETGGMTGFEDYVIWRGEKGVKAHVGLERRVAYAPGDSNRRTEEEFRANGKLHKREEYHGSKLDGIVEYYYPDGTLQSRTHYVEGERHGTKEVYHENGKLWLRGDFKDGEVDGLQEQWNKEGDLILREEWKSGEKVRTLPLDDNVQFRLGNREQMDQDYMAAVEAGDMEKAQAMVADAFKLAFPDTKVVDEDGRPKVLYHGSYKKGITKFNDEHKWSDSPNGTYWFTSKKAHAETYQQDGGDLLNVFLNIKNPLVIDAEGMSWDQLPAYYEVYSDKDGVEIDEQFDTYAEALAFAKEKDLPEKSIIAQGEMDTNAWAKKAKEKGYDGLIVKRVADIYDTLGEDVSREDEIADEYVAFAPNQIKSADPVTYDDEGNVIPLSKRFDSSNEDIRFRLANQSQNGFISNAEMALDKVKQEKATPEQWIKMLEKEGGMKAGEDKWLGLSDWLKSSDKKTLTKDEIGDFIEQNRIQIEEQRYSEAAAANDEVNGREAMERINDEFHDYVSEYQNGEVENDYNWYSATDYAMSQMVEKYGEDFREAFELNGRDLMPMQEYDDAHFNSATRKYLGLNKPTEEAPINPMRLDYSMPGLENKREIALTVPTIEPYFGSMPEVHFADDLTKGKTIAWIRFGDTNATSDETKAVDSYLAEMREKYGAIPGEETDHMTEEEIAHLQSLTSNEMDTTGPRVLVLEEIQSQRHEDARKYGGYKAGQEERKKAKESQHNARKDYYQFVKSLQQKYGVEEKGEAEPVVWHKLKQAGATNEEIDNVHVLYERWGEASKEFKRLSSDGVPAAPFEKNWHELAMKRMLRLAAEEGYDKIAWTTGDQQADRYNLGETLDSIVVRDEKWGREVELLMKDSGTVTLSIDENGKVTQSNQDEFEGKNLGDIVGKELAVKIMSAESGEEISGDGLRVGGEGMKGFYDDILPRFMNKYGKKWGVKVQDIELPKVYDETGHPLTMHSVDVTPEMKESVMEGQVMFKLGKKEAEAEVDKFRNKYTPIVPIYTMSVENDSKRKGHYSHEDGGRIIIFVNKQDDAEDVENTCFHENIHAYADKAGITEEQFAAIGDFLMEGFNEDDIAQWRNYRESLKTDDEYKDYPEEEFVSSVLPDMMQSEDIDAMQVYAKAEYPDIFNTINDFFNRIGYDARQEAESRTAQGEEANAGEGEGGIEEGSDEGSGRLQQGDQEVNFRKVTDPETLDRLNSEPTIKVYRAMQEIDGKLYPPMAAKVDGKLQEPIELGVWEEAVERPDLADEKGYFTLNKGNGKSLKARYNPYIHTSRSPLNDQFTSAYNRPNLVTVEVEVPESELTSGYKAEKAKDSVGEMNWHSGPVSSKLPEEKTRKVILTRYDKPIRIVPDSEVADRIAELLEGENIAVPYNTVTPSLREELEKRGVEISDAPSGTVAQKEAEVQFRISQDAVKDSHRAGLTGVIGDENEAELYRNVYKAVPKEIREQIVNRAGNSYLFSEAAKEMISEAVEKGDETGIAGLAANMLRDYIPLDEKTARYILWRGDRKQEDDDLLDTVKDIAMQRKYQVGEFAEQPMFRLGEDIEEATERAESMADDAKATMDEKKQVAREDNALNTIKAMSLQKEYDRKTVNTLTVLAKEIIKDQAIDTLNRREISRLLGIITTSVGKAPKTVKKNADALIDLMLAHLLKSEETKLGMLASTRASKVNSSGVEVQGTLDVRGQNVLKAYKAGLDMDLENPNDEFDENTINGRIAVLTDRLESKDDAVRSEAEDELAGLMLAKEYQENIKASINEERGIKNEMKDAAEQLRDGKISRTAYNEFVEDSEKAIRENRIERIEAYQRLRDQMASMMAGSIVAKNEFTENEKKRVEEIHHLANSDMQGKEASPFAEPTRWSRIANSSLVRFFAKPLVTFDQMLRLFGEKSVAGEGYLWNKFHRGWIEASEKAYLGEKEAKSELDEKVSEVFDKDMRWSDLYDVERKMPKVKVRWWDGGELKEHELTQGNLLYIYMVNKMTDGRMKLRRMGITQATVDAIARQMDDRFIELADWVQEKFLVEKRNKYNAVHERLFGASMAAIEDYFPLKINKRSLNKAEDLGRPDFDDALPATTTGSIIKRKRNAQDLDLLNADAFSTVIEHVEQMEQWAAFAEFNKDLNTLLSYKRFRNQVQNMATVYGSGSELWRNFKSVSRIVGGTYSPAGKKSDLDTAALNVAKGVTSAKISFRVYTALKQLLSMPAFISDANIKYLGENLATPWKAWNWAMENLPLFEKRVRSRMAGDTRLMNTDSDWKLWHHKLVEKLSRWGMSPNAFVDALTVSIGSHSIYQTRYDRYIKDGYTEEEADKKAKQDATTLYNETQQSNEGAFVAPVQLDRTVLATMITVFRNSSMGYQRQLHDAIRNIGKMMKPGYKEASIEFMKKQMERDGLTEEQAQHAAERNYEREKWRSAARVATFGFLVQFAWNLGGSIAYLLFGDDDDKKKEMLREAFLHGLIGGSMEGLSGGNVMSEAINMMAKGESLSNYDPSLLPIISDMKSAYKKMSYDPVAGSNDLINLAIQAGIGVNPQTLTDAVVAVVDACGGDLETSKEALLLMMRVLQVPQSQIDQVYIDELGVNADKARTMSAGEMAERYARYKVMKGAPLTGWAYSDETEEKREKAYLKSFKKKVKERKEINKPKDKKR